MGLNWRCIAAQSSAALSYVVTVIVSYAIIIAENSLSTLGPICILDIMVQGRIEKNHHITEEVDINK